MSHFKIENKKIKVEILGTLYELRKPKFKEVIDIEEKMASMNTKEKMLFIEGNLIKYGVPQEVINELDSSSVLELLEIVNGTKKN